MDCPGTVCFVTTDASYATIIHTFLSPVPLMPTLEQTLHASYSIRKTEVLKISVSLSLPANQNNQRDKVL